MSDENSTAPARHHSWWVVGAGVLVVLVGIAWWSGSPDGVATKPAPAAQPSSSAQSVAEAPEAVRAPLVPGAPRRVVIPALSVDAPVLPVRAPGRTLIPPSDPQQLGWWADGAKPGARKGSALVTGHTVHTGGGALDNLEDLRPGDPVVVRTTRDTVRYDVQRVRVYSKGSLAQHAREVFSQKVPGRLVLITCEDWNGVRYLSNVVVIAAPRR